MADLKGTNPSGIRQLQHFGHPAEDHQIGILDDEVGAVSAALPSCPTGVLRPLPLAMLSVWLRQGLRHGTNVTTIPAQSKRAVIP